MDDVTTSGILFTGGGIALVLGVGAIGVTRILQRQHLTEAKFKGDQIAFIVEETKATPVGAICIGLLFMTVLLSLGSYAAAKNIIQQIEAGISLLGGTVLFGLGAALGRRRTYHIMRSNAIDTQDDR